MAYDSLETSPEFRQCVAEIAESRPDRMESRDERLAFWINAYNITVLQSVVAHGLPDRVIDVNGFFKAERHTVGGQDLTLDEIENDIIRPFGDARIHAALVCAAMSCPELQPRLYAGAALDSQLTDASRRFLADTRRNVVNLGGGDVRLSKVFEWYADDFEQEYGSVMSFVRQYSPGNGNSGASAGDDSADIVPQYLEYDWTLNRHDRN